MIFTSLADNNTMSRPDLRPYHLIAFSLCVCVLLALTTATPVRRHASPDLRGYLDDPEYIPQRDIRQRLLASLPNRKSKNQFRDYGINMFGRRRRNIDGENFGPIRIPDFDATLD